MIKWFIDNLTPPYYEKMISIQVTYFASLIPIGEHIDEGIRSENIVDLESFSSMVEQQVKKMTGCKTKEVDVHMIDNASKRLRGITVAYATPALDLISNRVNLLKLLTEPLIREGGQTHFVPLGRKTESTLHYPCPWLSILTY